MHDYTVIFVEPVELEDLARAAGVAFAIPREQIEVWDGQDFIGSVVEPVVAQVAAGSEPGSFAEFVAFDAFAERTDAPTHLAVAIELATRVKKRAVFAPESAEDYQWTLVTADGHHGKVLLDSEQLDDGAVSILGTVEPIAGVTDLPQIGPEPL